MGTSLEWIVAHFSWKSCFLALCLGCWTFHRYWKQKNLPPGPWGLPFLGYYPFLGKTLHLTLAKLAKRYGDVMSVNLGSRLAVHLGSSEAIKEAFVNQSHIFAGRPLGDTFHNWIANRLGIAQSSGAVWQDHRHFLLKVFKEMGMGKRGVECRIAEVTETMLQTLEEERGQPIDIYPLVNTAAFNVICSLLFDVQYKRDDPELQKIQNAVYNFFRSLSFSEFLLETPWTRVLGVERIAQKNGLDKVKDFFFSTVDSIIHNHVTTLNPDHPRDYIDAFLLQIEQLAKSGDSKASTYSMERLRAICINIMFGGSVPVSQNLHWGFFHLASLPEVQWEVQKEIHNIVGKDRTPEWSDRVRMPYSEALVLETLRIGSVNTIPLIHRTTQETTLKGYTIPEGSLIMQNHWSLNTDEKRWQDPHRFDPSRFLDDGGKLIKMDDFIPFGIGKRTCLGESLARMEMFLILTSVLQRFSLHLPEGQDQSYHPSLIRVLNRFQLRVELRHE